MNYFNETEVNSTHYDSDEEENSLLYIVCVLLTLGLIDITTLVGNFIVVIAVFSTKSLHTVTNMLIVSLAIADMLVAILVLPLSIYSVLNAKWELGSIVCDIWIGSDVLLCTASILNLCCISIDRYFAIIHPLKYTSQRSPKLARTMISIAWIASFLISFPPVLGWKDKDRDKNTCMLNKLLSYRIYSSMGSFFLPCIVMIFVYMRIFKTINERETYLKSNTFNYMSSTRVRRKQPDQENELIDLKQPTQATIPNTHARGLNHLICCRKHERNSPLNTNQQSKSDSKRKLTRTLPNSAVGLKLATNSSSLNLKNSSISSGSSTRSTCSHARVKCKRSLFKKKQTKSDDSCLSSSNVNISKPRANSKSLIVKTNNQQQQQQQQQQEQTRLARENKATKTLAIVVGCFILSWLPFFIMYVLEAVLEPRAISKFLVDLLTWLGYFNSAINPFIYAFCSKQFRSAFYRVTFGVYKRGNNNFMHNYNRSSRNYHNHNNNNNNNNNKAACN